MYIISSEIIARFLLLRKMQQDYNRNYRPSVRLYHPALPLRNSSIKTSKRDQALSATSQCERRSHQRRHNARGDVIKLAFVKIKTVLGRKKI